MTVLPLKKQPSLSPASPQIVDSDRTSSGNKKREVNFNQNSDPRNQFLSLGFVYCRFPDREREKEIRNTERATEGVREKREKEDEEKEREGEREMSL